mgnify:CR=1 FL=1
MKALMQELRDNALTAVGAADSMEALEALRVKYLGKKGEMTAILKQMGKLSAEEVSKINSVSALFVGKKGFIHLLAVSDSDNLDVLFLSSEKLHNSLCLGFDGAGRSLLNKNVT